MEIQHFGSQNEIFYHKQADYDFANFHLLWNYQS